MIHFIYHFIIDSVTWLALVRNRILVSVMFCQLVAECNISENVLAIGVDEPSHFGEGL